MLRPSGARFGSCGRPTPESSLWGTQADVFNGRVPGIAGPDEEAGGDPARRLHQPSLAHRRFGHVPLGLLGNNPAQCFPEITTMEPT
jgi:hypothetical protein